jgi:hypothetical protein
MLFQPVSREAVHAIYDPLCSLLRLPAVKVYGFVLPTRTIVHPNARHCVCPHTPVAPSITVAFGLGL